MKKFSIYLLSVITVLLFVFTGYCDDRYEYIGKGADGSSFFLDKSSITNTNSPNVFRCWYKNIVSSVVRQRYINSRRDSNIKGKLLQLSYVLYCFDINLTQNTYKDVIEYTYDFNGNFIDSGGNPNQGVWENIPPGSVMELMSKAIKRITSNKSTNSLTPNSIVFTALLAGITISVLIVCFYSKFYSRKHTEATTYARGGNTAYSHTEAKHENTTSSRETVQDDFDYPYEDIGEITGL